MATIQSTIMLGCDGLTDLYVAQQESDLTAGWSVSQLALRNYQFAASNAMTKSVHDSLAALVTAAQAVLGAGSWPTGALAVEVLSGLVGDVRNGNFIPAGQRRCADAAGIQGFLSGRRASVPDGWHGKPVGDLLGDVDGGRRPSGGTAGGDRCGAGPGEFVTLVAGAGRRVS